jgi:2-polyprenyl-3-methyl-5-hydroxy-6-metoxy-1,4-benzoquinol methylase
VLGRRELAIGCCDAEPETARDSVHGTLTRVSTVGTDGRFPVIERTADTSVSGAICSPTDGSTVATGRLTVSGWSLVGSSPSRGVVALMHGAVVGGARTGLPSPDVAAELGIPEADKAGFSCIVDLHSAPDSSSSGAMTIDVAALLDDGTLSPVFASSTVLLGGAAADPNPASTVLEGSIDLPIPGSRVSAGVLTIEGWAAYGRRPVLEVFVQSGKQRVIRATRQVRTDVSEHFGAPSMEEYGFRAEIDLRHLIGRHEESISFDVAVIVDEDRPGDSHDQVVMTFGSLEVVVDGSLAPRGDNSPESTADVPAFLDQALAHAELGLAVPSRSRFHGTKHFVKRLSWSLLHRQVAFNKAVVAELTSQMTRAREDRVKVNAQLEVIGRALERLFGLRADLDQQLMAVDDLLHQQETAHRHQLDMVQRQAFQRHHEDLGGLRSELTDMALELDAIRKHVDNGETLFSQSSGGHSETSESLKSTYAAIEDTFRGSFDVIKDRAREYLGDVLALEGGGTVLDVGCGRGEWLEVLKEAGVDAYGVDLEEEFVKRCLDRGLDARRADAFLHMSSIPEHSLAVVTAFHVVEHLPTDMIVELIDLSAQTLRPGGLLMLETPNPENLVVGSSTFYIDPSHLRPLNPKFLAYLVAARGFVDVDVRFKHPDPALRAPAEDAPWAADILPVLDAVNSRLFGARDFAIVARRG